MEVKIYTALYRKWRPQTFEEVKGQEHITRTLANAVKTGKIAHAYLFVGPRGVGKTSVARIFAKALNCKKGPTPHPCNVCTNCVKITKGISLDVLEIDGASNRGIDQIRDLKERIKFASVEGRYKIYIIDEVHMLTNEAFNALLKTLEEPPSHVIFIFATTDPQKLPSTILSRCQRFDFRRLSPDIIEEEIEEILNRESIEYEKDALLLVSTFADGSMRDALSILEQVISYTEGHITYEKTLDILGIAGDEVIYSILKSVKEGERKDIIKAISSALERGIDLQSLYRDILNMLRDLSLYMIGGSRLLKDLPASYIKRLEFLSKIYDIKDVERLLDRFITYENQMKTTLVPRVVLEFLLLFGISRESMRQEEERPSETLEEDLSSLEETTEKEATEDVEEEIADNDNVEDIPITEKDVWDRLIESLDNKVLANSLKNNIESYKLESNKLILDIPQELFFYLEDKKKTLKDALKRLLGRDIIIELREIKSNSQDDHHLLKEGLSIFGGRIINLEED